MCIVDAQQRREARLSRRRERERRNCALESAEEREAQLARRRVRDRALRAAQSTAQREEALQRRRGTRETSEERTVRRRERERRNRALESTEDAVTIHKSQSLTPDPRRSSHQVVGPHMRNIRKLAQARPTMPAFL